jgi:hypothetical protein
VDTSLSVHDDASIRAREQSPGKRAVKCKCQVVVGIPSLRPRCGQVVPGMPSGRDSFRRDRHFHNMINPILLETPPMP